MPALGRDLRNYPPGGYVSADALTDPWGKPYQYQAPGVGQPFGSHNTWRHELADLPFGITKIEALLTNHRGFLAVV